MGQRCFILSQTEYSNILGIFTNVRQCRKHIETLSDQENLLLHEIRLNEPKKGMVNMTKLLYPPPPKEKKQKQDDDSILLPSQTFVDKVE
jgi:hypothetical protein